MVSQDVPLPIPLAVACLIKLGETIWAVHYYLALDKCCLYQLFWATLLGRLGQIFLSLRHLGAILSISRAGHERKAIRIE